MSMRDLLKGVIPEEDNPYIEEIVNQCHSCGHCDLQTPTKCAAFPDGIPLIIFLGQYDHTNPYLDDQGEVADQGLRYVPRDTPMPDDDSETLDK